MPHQPPDPTPNHTPPLAELAAMRRIVAALDPLDVTARHRVVGWLFDRYPPPRLERDATAKLEALLRKDTTDAPHPA